jgi:amidase
VNSVNGPMAGDLAALQIFAKAVVDREPWKRDPKCLPIPWRPVQERKALKFALCLHDNVVRPTPPVARALNVVAAKLRAAGHSVVVLEELPFAQGASVLVLLHIFS